MFNKVKELDPSGVAARSSQLHRRRTTYEVPGPDWMWCLDGYCKFDFVGIQIYAAIDAYSRNIIWGYCGLSARTQVSVKRQYCDRLRDGEVMPMVLRTDHGNETLTMAAAHYVLSNSARSTSEAELRFLDCYLFGTSTANQRIEAWWGQLLKGQLSRWRVRFPISNMRVQRVVCLTRDLGVVPTLGS